MIDAYLEGLGDHEGRNDLALAAHGTELDVTLAEELRRRLRALSSKGSEQ
jgi:hypothetical protein